MASQTATSMSSEGIHALDQLRQRLSQLSTSIGSLKADLERQDPLPSWTSLQSSAQILSHNLNQMMATFDSHRDFLSAAHAYPLPSFPGHTQENLLNQLLRKRLEPRTEEWLKEHGVAPATPLPVTDMQQLWTFAGLKSNSVLKEMLENGALDDDFTVEEQEQGIETVRTGLRRNLTGDEDDVMADAEQDEKPRESVESAPMPLTSVLRFMSTGKLS